MRITTPLINLTWTMVSETLACKFYDYQGGMLPQEEEDLIEAYIINNLMDNSTEYYVSGDGDVYDVMAVSKARDSIKLLVDMVLDNIKSKGADIPSGNFNTGNFTREDIIFTPEWSNAFDLYTGPVGEEILTEKGL